MNTAPLPVQPTAQQWLMDDNAMRHFTVGRRKAALCQSTGYVVGDTVQRGSTLDDGSYNMSFVTVDGDLEEDWEINIPGDANFALRDGHLVTMVWAVYDGDKNGPYLLYYNHNTRNLVEHKKRIDDFGGSTAGFSGFCQRFMENMSNTGGLAALFLLPIILMILVLMIVIGIGHAIFVGKRGNDTRKHIDKAKDSLTRWAESLRAK